MDILLEVLKERLNTTGKFKYIDEDWGQLEDYQAHPPVQFPCALISINSGGFSNIGIERTATPQNRQLGEFTLEVTVANLRLSNTSLKAPMGQKNNAHAVWTLLEEVHKVLQGWKPLKYSGALIRTSWRKPKRNDGIQEYKINYTFTLYGV